MRRKILKVNSFILTIIGIIPIVISTIYMLYKISIPSEPNSWDDFDKTIIIAITIAVYIFSFPLAISGIVTLQYLKRKKIIYYVLCMICNIIKIIMCILESVYLGYTDTFIDGKINLIIIIIIIIILILLNSILLYKEKK